MAMPAREAPIADDTCPLCLSPAVRQASMERWTDQDGWREVIEVRCLGSHRVVVTGFRHDNKVRVQRGCGLVAIEDRRIDRPSPVTHTVSNPQQREEQARMDYRPMTQSERMKEYWRKKRARDEKAREADRQEQPGVQAMPVAPVPPEVPPPPEPPAPSVKPLLADPIDAAVEDLADLTLRSRWSLPESVQGAVMELRRFAEGRGPVGSKA